MSYQRRTFTSVSAPVFRQVLARAEAAQARGVSVLDLKAVPWQSPGENVIEAARDALPLLRRAPARGLPELRTAIAERSRRECGAEVDPQTEVLVTNGCMEALWVAMFGLLADGEDVLFTEPCFIADRLAVLAGAHPVYAPLSDSDGWRLDLERLEKHVTENTRMIYICNPDNPTGRVSSPDEIRAILEFSERHDLICLIDEAFDHQVFDERPFSSALAFADWRDRLLVAQSFTKSFAMPGWRIGNLIGPSAIIDHLTQLHQWMMLDLPFASQVAAAEAIRGPQDWVIQLASDFQRNRDALTPVLNAIEGISFVTPDGGAFFFIDVSQLSTGSESIARRLLEEYGIPVNPGYNYRSPTHIRLAFGAAPADLGELMLRLPQAFAQFA